MVSRINRKEEELEACVYLQGGDWSWSKKELGKMLIETQRRFKFSGMSTLPRFLFFIQQLSFSSSYFFPFLLEFFAEGCSEIIVVLNKICSDVEIR